MIGVALSLIGNGLFPDAVFTQLREMYDDDVTDREILSVIQWAERIGPTASGYSRPFYPMRLPATPPKPKEITPEEAVRNLEKWLGGFRCDDIDLLLASPVCPDELRFLTALYVEDEFINIVTCYTTEKKHGKTKANPVGAGITKRRDDWEVDFLCNGTPHDEAGAWIRPNPGKEVGSGKGGAFCDRDVTAFRFCILEADELPRDLQISLWAALPLPVAAIIDSAGRSYHAWVKLDCANEQEWQGIVNQVYAHLAQFKICPTNKNPSRLSRLPGAGRKIGATGDGEQRLLYLNDAPREAPIFERRGA